MITLKNLISNFDFIKNVGNDSLFNKEISSLCFNTKEIIKNSIFFALKGSITDGHLFIDSAIEKGAIVIICEDIPNKINKDILYIQVYNSHKALGILASAYYGYPSKNLKVIGVTGTNGKTTIVTMLNNLFNSLGEKSGMISTIESYDGKEYLASSLTTPDPIQINKLMKKMVDNGCKNCFMEVSSHALIQCRIEGINFTGGVFTNITHDHLDFHKTFLEYVKAKQIFFKQYLKEVSFSLSNLDDKNGQIILEGSSSLKKYYSLTRLADFNGKIIENTIKGMNLRINNYDFWTSLIGRFNAYNLLAIYGVANIMGIKSEDILITLSNLKPPKGRLDFHITKNGLIGIVDYSHTPDALENVLKTINEIRTGNETLITIVGCGGNRDKTKRPKMTEIAIKYSNKTIITSDNPRNEDPEEILNDMISELNKQKIENLLKITDRREAIKTAIMFSKKNDIILIAGKGHENYQEIKGIKYHFDDKEEFIKFGNIN